MSRLSVEALEKSLMRLEEGFADAARYPELHTVRDGVTHRFEIAMDLSWKLMQRAGWFEDYRPEADSDALASLPVSVGSEEWVW
jgi:hypothetical protein